MALDTGKIRDFVQKTWDQSIVPTLHEYVKIPAKSPMFDAQWREHGHIDRAVELLRGWAGERPIEGLRIEVVRLEGRTPVIFMEAPGTGTDTVLLYGHLDKQPEMIGWAEGTGPWTPVRRGDKLYGRGVGDDGYATFAALTAIQALQEQRARHAREVAKVLGTEIYDRFPFPPGGMPVSTDPYELILNNTWRPALAITGAAGLPLPIDGGNVLRPQTSLKLSLRLPPTCEAGRAVRRHTETLDADPPYGA